MPAVKSGPLLDSISVGSRRSDDELGTKAT